MNKNAIESYKFLLNKYKEEYQRKKREQQLISILRLIFFATIILPLFLNLSFYAYIISTVSLVIFLFLIKRYNDNERQLEFFTNLVTINTNELEAAKGKYTQFDSGSEFIDPDHLYSFDLDLFGPDSFFRFINRTATPLGKVRLAELLQSGETNVKKIKQKQKAFDELAEMLNWRQHYIAHGMFNKDQSDLKLLNLPKEMTGIKNVQIIKLAVVVLPALTIVLLVMNILNWMPGSFVVMAILTQWIVFGLSSKKIKQFHLIFGNQSVILGKYSKMFQNIEETGFQSDILNSKKSLLSGENKSAAKITAELKKIISELDYRQNILVGFILNSILLWDTRCIYRLHQWNKKYQKHLNEWFDVLAEFDAYCSLSNIHFNYPHWSIPQIQKDNYDLTCCDLGHPMIEEKRRINNDFNLTDAEQIVIITGANMAGKSTFLRTIGINLVLASAGCRVCAKSFRFSPVKIFTNMRTTDNLMKDESYFYAELLRLQKMLELLRKGEKLFIIIDEMLKGTNSTDKLNGSKELIKQLIGLNTHGVVATHDLHLTDLSKEYPESIKNQCFEVQLNNDELTFNYKLSDGITQTMNASFLMKKMGIVP